MTQPADAYFTHDPIDLGGPAFRLLRILKGRGSDMLRALPGMGAPTRGSHLIRGPLVRSGLVGSQVHHRGQRKTPFASPRIFMRP